MADFYQVNLAASSSAEAERLAALAVERRLAACAQVSGPIRSTYRWKGKVERAEEWVCALKTTARMLDALIETLRLEHSYDVPEIIAVPIERGDDDYLCWVEAEAGGV